MKDLNGEEMADPGSGGATGIFGALADESPAKVEATPLMSVPAAPRHPEVAASSGGFTQLLRTLSNYEPAAESTRAPVVEAVKTTPLEARPVFSSAASSHAAAAVPAAAPAEAFPQMFEAAQPVPASAPVAAAPAAAAPTSVVAAQNGPAAMASGSGGFTQMFQALDSDPPVAPLHVQAETLKLHQANDAPAAIPSALASAGGFTQMFQALGNETRMSPAPSVPSAVPVVSSPIVSAPLVPASVLAQPAVTPVLPAAEPLTAAQPAAAPYSSGGITQLLRTISMNEVAVPKSTPLAPAVIPPVAASVDSPDWSLPAVAPTAAAPQGSSLTSVFNTVAAVANTLPFDGQTAVSVTPAARAADPTPTNVPTPTFVPTPITPSTPVFASPRVPVEEDAGGSFTQLFRTLDRSAAASGTPAAAPPQASFTQVFSLGSTKPAGEASQADQFPPLPASAARAEYTPASPEFGEPAHRGWEEPHFSSPPPTPRPAYPGGGYAEPHPPTPAAAASSGGGSAGLTQLLRTLDGPGSTAPPSGRAESLFPAPAASPRVDTSMGFGAPPSSGATTAFRLPYTPASAAPTTPTAAAGPGEFTGIVQASALRESTRQGGGVAASPAPAPAPSPAASSGFSMPSGFSSIPGGPVMPTMPTASGGGGGGGFGSHHLPTLPTVPVIPGVTLPTPSAPAAGAGGGSKMLPILLMVVIVLLIAVLLAVVLMMKH